MSSTVVLFGLTFWSFPWIISFLLILANYSFFSLNFLATCFRSSGTSYFTFDWSPSCQQQWGECHVGNVLGIQHTVLTEVKRARKSFPKSFDLRPKLSILVGFENFEMKAIRHRIKQNKHLQNTKVKIKTNSYSKIWWENHRPSKFLPKNGKRTFENRSTFRIRTWPYFHICVFKGYSFLSSTNIMLGRKSSSCTCENAPRIIRVETITDTFKNPENHDRVISRITTVIMTQITTAPTCWLFWMVSWELVVMQDTMITTIMGIIMRDRTIMMERRGNIMAMNIMRDITVIM